PSIPTSPRRGDGVPRAAPSSPQPQVCQPSQLNWGVSQELTSHWTGIVRILRIPEMPVQMQLLPQCLMEIKFPVLTSLPTIPSPNQTIKRNTTNHRGTLASRAEVPQIMPHYRAIRSFLSNHHGYYCEECLGPRLNLSMAEIRRSVGHRTLADVTIAYRICQSCLSEKAVFALRMSA